MLNLVDKEKAMKLEYTFWTFFSSSFCHEKDEGANNLPILEKSVQYKLLCQKYTNLYTINCFNDKIKNIIEKWNIS